MPWLHISHKLLDGRFAIQGGKVYAIGLRKRTARENKRRHKISGS